MGSPSAHLIVIFFDPQPVTGYPGSSTSSLSGYKSKSQELRSGDQYLQNHLDPCPYQDTSLPLTHPSFHLNQTNMPIRNIAIGRPEEATHPDALKAALAEFISMLIFVFAGEGSGMAFNKLTNNGAATPAGLIAAAIAHAFALFVAVAVGANISGGHVNPAVTFGAFVGGNISLLRGILYWIAQLLGSVAACALLKFATGGLVSLLVYRHPKVGYGSSCVSFYSVS